MFGVEFNDALAWWVLTRVVVPACALLIVFMLVDAMNTWRDEP